MNQPTVFILLILTVDDDSICKSSVYLILSWMQMNKRPE